MQKRIQRGSERIENNSKWSTQAKQINPTSEFIQERKQIHLLGLILTVTKIINTKQKWMMTKQFLLSVTNYKTFILVHLNKL